MLASAPTVYDWYSVPWVGWQKNVSKINLTPWQGKKVRVAFAYVVTGVTGSYSGKIDAVNSVELDDVRVSPKQSATQPEPTMSANSWDFGKVYVGETEDYSFTLADVQPGKHVAQIDDFRVGREGGEEVSVAGFVKSYDLTLDGEDKGSTLETEMLFPSLGEGRYTVGVLSVYASGASEYVTYEFDVPEITGIGDVEMAEMAVVGGNGVIKVTAAHADVKVYTTAGVAVAAFTVSGEASVAVAPGVYVVAAGTAVRKVTVK